MEKRRRVALAVTALLFVAAFNHRPLIAVNIAAPSPPVAAPARLQAAIDLGRSGVTILISWGADRLAR